MKNKSQQQLTFVKETIGVKTRYNVQILAVILYSLSIAPRVHDITLLNVFPKKPGKFKPFTLHMCVRYTYIPNWNRLSWLWPSHRNKTKN